MVHDPYFDPAPPIAKPPASLRSGQAVASLTLALASVVFCLIPGAGIFAAALGLGLGLAALRLPGQGLAITAVTISAVFLVLSIISTIGFFWLRALLPQGC